MIYFLRKIGTDGDQAAHAPPREEHSLLKVFCAGHKRLDVTLRSFRNGQLLHTSPNMPRAAPVLFFGLRVSLLSCSQGLRASNKQGGTVELFSLHP